MPDMGNRRAAACRKNALRGAAHYSRRGHFSCQYSFTFSLKYLFIAHCAISFDPDVNQRLKDRVFRELKILDKKFTIRNDMQKKNLHKFTMDEDTISAATVLEESERLLHKTYVFFPRVC